MPLNVPTVTRSLVSFGPGLLFIGAAGTTPTVDVGAIGNDGVTIEIELSKSRIMRGNPRKVDYIFTQAQSLKVGFHSIEWNFNSLAYALGAGNTTALSTVETFAFGNEPVISEVAIHIQHEMCTSGNTLNVYVWRAFGLGQTTIPFNQDEHSFPYKFEALKARTSWDGTSLAADERLVRFSSAAATTDNCPCPTEPEYLPEYTDLGMSDEFPSSPLNAKWTPVASGGSSMVLGTVDIEQRPASNTNIYDLTTRADVLLLQPRETFTSSFRQDAVIADGEQIIITMTVPNPGGSSETNDVALGVSFNDDDTHYDNGNFTKCHWDGTQEGASGDGRIRSSNGAQTGVIPSSAATGWSCVFRAIRSGNTLYWFWSGDMRSWCPVGTGDMTGLDNFWLFFDAGTYGGHPGAELDPIVAFYSVRHMAYTGDLDPWPLT